MALIEGKRRKLFLGLLFDGIGMVSLLIPGIGAAWDLIWAPVAAGIMTRMYAGSAGRVAGLIAFVEEVLPGTDIVPSFTLMWLYTYVLRKNP